MAFVDRPIARWVFHHQHYWMIFKVMASPSLLSLPVACLYLAGYAIATLLKRQTGPHTRLFLTICIATVVASAAKDELKWLFGRPWPAEWYFNHVYRFHPFTDNFSFGGFPSGHTTYIAAPMFVLWWRLPQYRALWIGIIFAVMIGLVGSGYHFVGDVIAGFFLGLAAAAGTIAAWPEAMVGNEKSSSVFLQKRTALLQPRRLRTSAPPPSG
jgi:membrane-associated phospholipid phosphatase